jgi:hypothetical protein
MLRCVLGAWALLVAAAAPPTERLNERTYATWRDHIRPRPAELRWQEVPWRATLWDAVVEAQRQEKPILLWAMNGHPLACT